MPSYQVLAAHLHVQAAVFTQEALAKHTTNTASPVNRLAVLNSTHSTALLLWSSQNRVTCFC